MNQSRGQQVAARHNPTPAPRQTAVALIDDWRRTIEQMRPQFQMALGSEERAIKFVRVVMTALQNNLKLLQCDKRSVINAAMKAAQDDLLPDGREGAIVPFAENEDGQKKSDQAQWMPMVAGLRKKARKSGEIVDMWVDLVHEGDHYVYRRGDDPIIEHTPRPGGRRNHDGTRPIIAAYSIVKFKDGTLSREWMWIEEIEDIRKEYSKAKKGPWSNPVSYPEMCKKTVFRQHAKTLPSSTDLDQVMRHDAVFFDPQGGGIERERRARVGRPPGPASARPAGANAALAHFGNGTDADPGDGEPVGEFGDPGDPRPGDGDVIEHEAQSEDPAPEEPADPSEVFADLIRKAQKNPPKNLNAFGLLTRGLIDAARGMGSAGADALKAWWPSDGARALRNKAGMTADDTATVFNEVKVAVDELKTAAG